MRYVQPALGSGFGGDPLVVLGSPFTTRAGVEGFEAAAPSSTIGRGSLSLN